MALLEAYFDESGMHGTARAVVMAGAVGTADQWVAVEDAWNGYLAAEGIEVFHMTECQRGKGAFKAIPEERRQKLILDLADALVSNGIVAVGSAVLVDAWRDADIPDIKARFPKPYNLAFEHCLQQVNTWASAHHPGDEVVPMFAQTQEFAKRAAEVAQAYQESRRFRDTFSRIVFGDARRVRLLQVGDMIAYETFKWAEQSLDGNQEPRPVMRKLAQAGSLIGGLYDADALAVLQTKGPRGRL